MFVSRKTWRAFLSGNTRFEIHPFVLLPTTPGSNKGGGGCPSKHINVESMLKQR